jgi:hypothetical protein
MLFSTTGPSSTFGEVCVRAVLPGHPGDAAYPGRLVTVLADRLA